MAKWPNHFISGKQFQKGPNGDPASNVTEERYDKFVQYLIVIIIKTITC